MMRDTIILRVVVKLLLPAILIFALYVQFHGDYGPGGGFQAGVAAAAAVILYGLVFGVSAARKVIPQRILLALIPLGVLIFAGTGIFSLFLGANYLDYSPFGTHPEAGQHLGILIVEVGVFVTVSSSMLAIFYAFGGRAEDALASEKEYE
jgi:multicomponent Na+:H+ antiporter subunit B|tara:strand:- start:9815 stop:10264 length:450 start_codon:yes stop_codon:yes gene_type:complete